MHHLWNSVTVSYLLSQRVVSLAFNEKQLLPHSFLFCVHPVISCTFGHLCVLLTGILPPSKEAAKAFSTPSWRSVPPCSFGRDIWSSPSPSSCLKLGPEQLVATLDWMFFRGSFPIKIENVQADAMSLSEILVSGRFSHTTSGIMECVALQQTSENLWLLSNEKFILHCKMNLWFSPVILGLIGLFSYHYCKVISDLFCSSSQDDLHVESSYGTELLFLLIMLWANST